MAIATNASRLQQSDVPGTRPVSTLAEDVRHGLIAPPRTLPPKYFYDDHGSRLFEAICETPEYYPTRTEAALLARHARAIIEQAAPDHLLEFGSGNSQKTRHLIDACDQAGRTPVYWPFDVSAPMMIEAGERLASDYPWLHVHALMGDYNAGLGSLPLPEDDSRRLLLFLGGTLGNFEPAAATDILREMRCLMAPGDTLLLGLDRVKAVSRLEAAYDDEAGWTAAFNRNVLRVLNRELAADFPVDDYRHLARFNQDKARIEMRLVASRAHTVHIDALDLRLDIADQEQILTEISRKFSVESIDALLASANLRWLAHFEADQGDYSLVLAGPG